MMSVALKATLPPRLATRAIAVRHADENAKMAPILLPRSPDLPPRRPYRPRAQHSSGRRFGQDGLQGDFAPFRFGIVLATPRSGV